MKFSIFLHMERYDEDVSHRELFEQLVDLCVLAEAGGFEKAWIGEHHGMEYTISPNPLPLLAAVAERTSTLRLGAGTLVAPFWHPLRMAGEAALLDVICNGRAEIGIARGAYQFEFDRITNGMAANDGGRFLRELVPVVQKLWAGDYAHEGEIWQFPQTTSVPKPVQQPGPPIWIAARDPDSHKFAVANGCSVMVTPLAKGDAEVTDLVAKFDAACAAAPQQPRPQLLVLQHAHVHDDEAELVTASEAISYFFRAFGTWFANMRPPVNGFHKELPPLNAEKFADLVPETLRGNVMIGRPEEVIARLKSYEAQGVDEYSIWVDSSLPYEMKRDNIERFIRDILPAFA